MIRIWIDQKLRCLGICSNSVVKETFEGESTRKIVAVYCPWTRLLKRYIVTATIKRRLGQRSVDHSSGGCEVLCDVDKESTDPALCVDKSKEKVALLSEASSMEKVQSGTMYSPLLYAATDIS